MLIRVVVSIYVDTQDPQRTCGMLDSGLERALDDFPAGEVIQTDVDWREILTEEQVRGLGLDA